MVTPCDPPEACTTHGRCWTHSSWGCGEYGHVGNDHWVWHTDQGVCGWCNCEDCRTGWTFQDIIFAEVAIRNLGRNLAVAGALRAAYEDGWATGWEMGADDEARRCTWHRP